MKGMAVRQIQEALAALYFYPKKGAKNNGIDGYYGEKTADEVRRFQLMHGLSADWIYASKTKAKLEALLKERKGAGIMPTLYLETNEIHLRI